jgi:hypothetical protein
MTEQSTQLSDADQRTATRAAEAKAKHWQGIADEQRKTIEQLSQLVQTQQGELADLKASYALLREVRGWRRRVRRWLGM